MRLFLSFHPCCLSMLCSTPRSDHGISDGGLGAREDAMLRALSVPHRRGWRLSSEHRDCCIQKAYHLCIFFGCSQGRNAVAIFGKRESPQLSIYCLQLQELSMSAVASTYTTPQEQRPRPLELSVVPFRRNNSIFLSQRITSASASAVFPASRTGPTLAVALYHSYICLF